MKVLQTIHGLSASSGGPSTCTHDLMVGLADIAPGVVDLFTLKNALEDEPNLGIGQPWLVEGDCDYWSPVCFSQNVRHYLNAGKYDLYHCNGLWRYINHMTCKVARSKRRPYVITTHGMMYPTALSIKPLIKSMMLNLWFSKDIHNASCVHVTCWQELEHIRSFGYKGPIAVIPNCVVFPKGVSPEIAHYKNEFYIEGKRQFGFLGRLHPIKCVENIIYAISQLTAEERNSLSFQIMGKYDDNYEKFLRNEVDRLDLKESVNFVGFVEGTGKYARLSQLSALLVPSAQENFGMIVPEALICGVPVYASYGTPWRELEEYSCGWWRDNSPETIASVIREVLSMENEELREMGVRGYVQMKEKYEQHKVAQMMIDLYSWLLGNGIKPSFVYE